MNKKSSSIKIVGVINVSPESFYKKSVASSEKALIEAVYQLNEQGADLIDIGAMSTAPYLTTQITEEEETKRLAQAIRIAKRYTSIPLSADTSRRQPAQAAFDEGATWINDVSGLSVDPTVVQVMKKATKVILMAHPSLVPQKTLSSPIKDTRFLLNKITLKAQKAGIAGHKIIVDPGIGFFRQTTWPWWSWDLQILKGLKSLSSLKFPILIGVSRKSFIGHVLKEKDPQARLAGSLAATAIAILNGASYIRTHDVAETKKAALLAAEIRDLKSI